jgi:hypothetical protein
MIKTDGLRYRSLISKRFDIDYFYLDLLHIDMYFTNSMIGEFCTLAPCCYMCAALGYGGFGMHRKETRVF